MKKEIIHQDLEEIFKQNSVKELCGFINRKPIFKDVDSRQKFCTLIFTINSKQSDNLLVKYWNWC